MHQDDTNQGPTLVVTHSDSELSMGHAGSVLLGIWRTDMRVEHLGVLARGLSGLTAALPGQKLGMLNLIETGCSLELGAEGAKALAEMLKRHADVLVGSALVYAREGFWNASLHSRATAVHTDSQARVPYLIAPSLFDAATWLVDQFGPRPSMQAPQIVQALTQLRFER